MNTNPNADPFHEKRDAEAVAEAMRANGYTVADGFTMRRRLDDWHLIRADLRPTFAAYLRDIPNGGAK